MKLENYKVFVSNESESKEVQGLFFELGYVWRGLGDKSKDLFLPEKLECYSIIAYHKTMDMQLTAFDFNDAKELTIQQLRDLVANQKTIGKVPYLVKTIDKWEEQQLTSDTPESATCLKIPDGADNAVLYKNGFVEFFKSIFCECYHNRESRWFDCSKAPKFYTLASVIWQRLPETMHTRCVTVPVQPEELPFIDDEPKMTDIEKTLNERQSQYGSFEDVATVTQDLLAILERTGLKSLPKPHKEALHMICSKMARIVNGDFDYIENWHDIAGYATLMERDLKTKDGATNSKVVRTRVINGIMQEI